MVRPIRNSPIASTVHVFMPRLLFVFISASAAYLPYASGAINIDLDFGNTSAEDLTNYGATFSAAENFWETKLTGYRDSAGLAPSSISIEVSLSDIDGVGGTLGSAGPTAAFGGGNFLEVSAGSMTFDTADLDYLDTNGTFESVIRHEMAHVLGFGTLWSSSGVGLPGFQEVYVEGSGQYTGAAALAAYQTEFGQAEASFVPVELDGGAGTADGHWNEVADNFQVENSAGFDIDPGDGGPAPTIVGGQLVGESLDDDLMTGILSGSAFLSNTTLASFSDIGYTTVDLMPIPEAQSFASLAGLLVLGIVYFSRCRRRPTPPEQLSAPSFAAKDLLKKQHPGI